MFWYCTGKRLLTEITSSVRRGRTKSSINFRLKIRKRHARKFLLHIPALPGADISLPGTWPILKFRLRWARSVFVIITLSFIGARRLIWPLWSLSVENDALHNMLVIKRECCYIWACRARPCHLPFFPALIRLLRFEHYYLIRCLSFLNARRLRILCIIVRLILLYVRHFLQSSACHRENSSHDYK